MYRVSFLTYIFAPDADDACETEHEVIRTLDLPFMPGVGLVMRHLRFEDDEFVVVRVTYDLIDRTFWVETDDDSPIYHWKEPFTAEDAKDFIEYGCVINGSETIEHWVEAQERMAAAQAAYSQRERNPTA
jgi:hypothetical protein